MQVSRQQADDFLKGLRNRITYNHLTLVVTTYHAEHAGDGFQRRTIDKLVIFDNKAQTRHTVRDRRDVINAAQCRYHRACQRRIIFGPSDFILLSVG